MKQGIIIFMLIMLFGLCVGCTHTYSINGLKEGTYFSEEDYETEDFSKGSFLIKRINKEEFDSSSGINVLKVNYSNSLSSYYYCFEMYLFSKISNQEELVQITNYEYTQINGSYTGDAYLKILDKEYYGEIRMDYYSPVGVSLFDFACRYYLETNR